MEFFAPSTAEAQEQIAIQADVLFYGDNTEFRNPFREGETIFGSAARLGVAFDLNDRVTLLMGAFGNLRFGSDEAFDDAKPVLSLTVRGKRSAFVFGTLARSNGCRSDGTGPRRTTRTAATSPA